MVPRVWAAVNAQVSNLVTITSAPFKMPDTLSHIDAGDDKLTLHKGENPSRIPLIPCEVVLGFVSRI